MTEIHINWQQTLTLTVAYITIYTNMNRPKTDGQKNGKKVGNITQQQYKNTTFKVNIVKVKADYKTTEMLLRESKYMFEVKNV